MSHHEEPSLPFLTISLSLFYFSFSYVFLLGIISRQRRKLPSHPPPDPHRYEHSRLWPTPVKYLLHDLLFICHHLAKIQIIIHMNSFFSDHTKLTLVFFFFINLTNSVGLNNTTIQWPQKIKKIQPNELNIYFILTFSFLFFTIFLFFLVKQTIWLLPFSSRDVNKIHITKLAM